MKKLLYEKETYQILGACFEVYKDKGCGFLEPVYQECLEIELAHLGIPFTAQQEIALTYRGRKLNHGYRTDLVCFGKIIVELKAVSKILNEHRAQTLNYLHATSVRVGLVANFGHYPKLEHERFVI